VVLVGVLAAVTLAVGNAGFARITPGDGSAYTWQGAGSISADVSPAGAGYVRSSPYLIDCPSACVRPVDPGATIILTASPTSGYAFAGWTGPCAGQDNPCTLTTTSALVDVTASFSGHYVPPAPAASSLRSFTLTVNNTWFFNAAGPAGQICAQHTLCQFVYTEGTTVTFTSLFAFWIGCDGSAGDSCTVTMNNDRTIRAL
jgi:uncharacterized repeat protein (TIGR02543 family)